MQSVFFFFLAPAQVRALVLRSCSELESDFWLRQDQKEMSKEASMTFSFYIKNEWTEEQGSKISHCSSVFFYFLFICLWNDLEHVSHALCKSAVLYFEHKSKVPMCKHWSTLTIQSCVFHHGLWFMTHPAALKNKPKQRSVAARLTLSTLKQRCQTPFHQVLWWPMKGQL